MRFDKGVKTGVKRVISEDNILRWGRFKVEDESFIDHDINAPKTPEWDCGYIVGAGIYPDSKIVPPGGACWIGTTHQALLEFWWPRFAGGEKCLFPVEFIDRRAAHNGFMKSEWTVHCVRGTRITVISYESGFRKYEAEEVNGCVFDEESPDPACVTAAINHCRYFSMVMTPYNGMTYTKKLIFDPKKDPKNNQVFHATSYDSPYLTVDTIKHRRSMMSAWEIGARIWGLHTEAKGKPYFDRNKINIWIRKFKTPFKLRKFVPAEEYDGIISRDDHNLPGLMSVDIITEDNLEEENRQDIWRIYEERDDDTAYYLMADSAEGSDIPSESGDVLAALVMRPPKDEERYPQIVASLRSTLKTQSFARSCLAAARYWNNALLCAEGPTRGSFNALFYAEAKDWPYWFQQGSMRDSTRRLRTVKGFDTNAATRGAIFDAIRGVLDEFDKDERPEINDEPLLIELAACVIKIKNGKPRPDHTEESSLDTAICFGQGLWIHEHYRSQIKCRAIRKERSKGFRERMSEAIKGDKPPLYLGEGVKNLR
jgi:phage terminase large subunit-like protein